MSIYRNCYKYNNTLVVVTDRGLEKVVMVDFNTWTISY